MYSILFSNPNESFIVLSSSEIPRVDIEKLSLLLQANPADTSSLEGSFIGPRKEMVTPWSTNATEIMRNMGIANIERAERFFVARPDSLNDLDPMLEAAYKELDADTLLVKDEAEQTRCIEDIRQYNEEAALALSEEEISFLEAKSKELGRPFTDAELFAFGQINSEHCRHKIFNGSFIIDGQAQEKSLFQMIKDTSASAPQNIVSAYSDNAALMKGANLLQFAPQKHDSGYYYELNEIEADISLKAETHNFPTTVEPFYGASTGSGGEIRDRMAVGRGSIPLSGSAVYMTAFPRLNNDKRNTGLQPRKWKYQSPEQILIKASNGASDFGNKFGQPLIVGSLLTFEAKADTLLYGYDRCIMLAGGVGYANHNHALKNTPKVGDKIVLLGGDNYRIGMAGGSVSSVNTGEIAEELELSAVQRANPEMQKRAYNVIRTLVEKTKNPICSIHDHGAGGHINCFSELIEAVGGIIDIDALPIGDKTLSAKEILCNESQERMGLVVSSEDIPLLLEIAERERSPIFIVGEVTGSEEIVFEQKSKDSKAVNLPTSILFGSSPKTTIEDKYSPLDLTPFIPEINNSEELIQAIEEVLSFESVACKDWLTNKVDRSVTGLVAMQQCTGPLQLPLNNLGISAVDYTSPFGIASSLGHAPIVGIIDEQASAELSVAEALTNILWAPLEAGLASVSLSANWMWPAKQSGEDSKLYRAVAAISAFCIKLGIPIPTGKDSLSMTMKYSDGKDVRAPGTVIVSATAPVSDYRKTLSPALRHEKSTILHVDFSDSPEFELGASVLALAKENLGSQVPKVKSVDYFAKAFNTIQDCIQQELLLAGHDISSGGLITALLEMAFSGDCGLTLKSSQQDLIPWLFCEKPGVLIQVEDDKLSTVENILAKAQLNYEAIASLNDNNSFCLEGTPLDFSLPISDLRRIWYRPSHLLDKLQCKDNKADKRFSNFEKHPLTFDFPNNFSGQASQHGVSLKGKDKGPTAAIIREKGINGEREMAYSLFAAGFSVKDITMSDLMTGREDLSDVNFIVFPGGFSNSDVLGASRGWAGAFRYNEKADRSLKTFYAREDTLSLGVCNGCQLMTCLNLLYPEHEKAPTLAFNASGKFESHFLRVNVNETNSIMFKNLSGCSLGIWVAHGEGQFILPEDESSYNIPLKYVSNDYPANPNASQYNTAGLCSKDGRHLAMMPHIERAILPWQWAYYPPERSILADEVSPWALAFVNAREWIMESSHK